MSHFKYHVLVCNHLKSGGKGCYGQVQAAKAVDFLKQQARALGITGVGGVRVSAAGCLGRCSKKPVLVIYPQAIWYRYENEQDLQEIINKHLLNDQIIERLHIADFS